MVTLQGDIKDVSDDKEGYGSEDGDKIEGSGSVDGQHHKHKGNRTKARRGALFFKKVLM